MQASNTSLASTDGIAASSFQPSSHSETHQQLCSFHRVKVAGALRVPSAKAQKREKWQAKQELRHTECACYFEPRLPAQVSDNDIGQCRLRAFKLLDFS